MSSISFPDFFRLAFDFVLIFFTVEVDTEGDDVNAEVDSTILVAGTLSSSR